jgi:hypothetical protein
VTAGTAVDDPDTVRIRDAGPARIRDALALEDAANRALAAGATYLEVTAGPASGFYEKVTFSIVDRAETRFGPAMRMRREL